MTWVVLFLGGFVSSAVGRYFGVDWGMTLALYLMGYLVGMTVEWLMHRQRGEGRR